MANPEHLKILKRGVEEWNQWREANPSIQPDLSEAYLSETDLSRAKLIKAKLIRAKLTKADLRQADLGQADLRQADLDWADLRIANLIRADLTGASLGAADLTGAVLRETDLSDANLITAKLYGAELRRANLRGANLFEANLGQADLFGADLHDASLRTARLMNANLDGANLTGACLWETQRAGWSIKDVICESVFWDEEGKEETFYSPGEFERLFADKTRVKLFYEDGINPIEIATIPALIKHLENSHPGCGLRLVSIHEDSGGVVVELAIEDDGHSPEQLKQLKTEIEATAQRAIAFERKFLAEEKQRLQLEGALKQSDAIINKLILRPSVNFQGDYNQIGNTYNVSGQAGAVGDNAHAHDMTFNQIGSRIESTMDLTALASELEVLRQALKKEATTEEHDSAVADVGKAKKAAEAKDSAKLAESLKSAGKWAFDVATKIGVSLATEAIKQSTGMK